MRSILHAKTLASLILPVLLALSTLGLISTAAAQDMAATPVAATGLMSAMTADEAVAAVTQADGRLRFDVAENGTRFTFAPSPVFDDGSPAYGNPFITQGYIYPAGTLTGSNGVLEDGSPEFPDQVLGEWVCRGWFVGEGMQTTTGAMVITTQVYNFGGALGSATLVSDGYELADVGVAIQRAITGGTGPFAAVGGEVHRTFLGFNPSMGVNLQFELDVRA